jgi:hypothetical protein
MRLSLQKAAHAALGGAAYRKSGSGTLDTCRGRSLDFDGEGGRRPAGSGAAEYASCDSIRDALLAYAGYGEPKARPACKVRGDGGGSEGAKALPIRAACLLDLRTRSGSRAGHFGHAPASMRTVSTAADGQKLLRGGEREHGCRWQQRTENAQQHECCNPPHEVSLHATACAAHGGALRYKT